MHGFQKHTRSRRIALLILFLAIIIPLTGCDHPGQDNNSAVARAAVLTADPEHSFLLDILSTGKSDCLLFRADGHTVLIDTADTDDVTVILSHLYRLGITRLDYLILTHFDNDHVGGAAGIVSAIPVGEILAPNYIRRSSACLALEDAIQEKGVPLTRMAEGRTLVLGEATLQIDTTSLFGSDILSSESDGGDDIDENNFSLVTYLTYGSFSSWGTRKKPVWRNMPPLIRRLPQILSSCRTTAPTPRHCADSWRARTPAVPPFVSILRSGRIPA